MGYSDPPFDRPPPGRPPVPQGQHYNPHHAAPWPHGLPPRLPPAYPQAPPGARLGPPGVPPHPAWPAVPPAGPPLPPAAGFAPPPGHPGYPTGTRPGLAAAAPAAHPGSAYPPAWLRPPPPQAWARPQAPPPPLPHAPPMAAQPTRSQPPGAVQPAAPVHQPIITAEEIMAMAKEQEEEERKAEAEKEAKRQEEQKRLREEARKQRLAALRERQQAEAWTAHKSDDGRVYFYNTLTEQSSWEKPSGYTGPVEVVEGEPEPVSFKPIKGTAWTQVSCKDGRTYYSNSATGATAWCLPDELLEVLADMEEDAAASGVQPLTAETAGILARVAAASGGSTLRPEYKTYLGSGKGATGPSAGPGPVASSGEDAAGAAAAPGVAGRTAAAAGNGAGPSGVQLSKEEAVLKFKELLLDAGVTPFSRFEKEAAKLAKDARWSLVPQRERRLIFDAFCKNVATEQRRLKEERAAASRRSFLDLIALFLAELRADAASQRQRQEHVNADAEMVEAAAADAAAAAADGEAMAASSAHGGRDEMPTAADEKEEGEAPEDEEPGDGGFGSTEREEAAAAVAGRSQESGADEEPAVVAVPADTPEDSGVPADVDMGTMEQRWGDDPRWKACPAALRQELFAELVEPLVQQAQRRRDRLQKHWRSLFTTLLTEQAGMRPGAELPRLERWPELSLSLRGDARFRAVPRQHHRAFFEEHLRNLQALESAKRKEAEERRNSRRELAERAEKHGEEAHRRRMRAQHSEAVAAFRTLLAEVVKDAAAQWRDWRTKLERDPQGRAKSDVLPVQEMESIFREHLSNLKGAIHKRYRQLLTEAIAPLLPQTRRAHDLAMAAAPSAAASSGELPEAAVNWEAALPLLEGDARFQRMPASDRETVWRKFVDDSMGGKEDPGAPAKPEPAVRPAASSGPPVATAPPPNHGVMADDRAPGRDRRGPRPLQAPREEELRQPAAAGSSRHGAAADQLDGEGGGRRHGERARLEREPDQDRGRARDPDRHRPSERSSHHREGPERDRDRDHHRDREREKDRDREHRDRERPRDRDRDWDRGRDRDRDRDKKRARH